MYNVFLTKLDDSLKIKCTKITKIDEYLIFKSSRCSHSLNLGDFIEGEKYSCIIWNNEELYVGAYHINPFIVYSYKDVLGSLKGKYEEKFKYMKSLSHALFNNTADTILNDEIIDLQAFKELYEILSLKEVKTNQPVAQVLFY